MSLKSIRESYSKLLNVFKEAGIKLTESQKSDVDNFVLAVESNMSNQRRQAIRQTKKAVERKMEKEYKEVFENIMSAMQQNAELASKIQEKIARLDEQKIISNKVNDYLELYVESVLPNKSIVDYDRMHKLERIHESLRDALIISDDAVENKILQLEESFKLKKSKCETKIAKMQVKLNEAVSKNKKLKKHIDSFKAAELLESKTKDLPTFEARRVRKALAEASTSEIEQKFDKTLKEVNKEAEIVKKSEMSDLEQTLEHEIKNILEQDVDENDMLNDRVHNNHISEAPISEKTEDNEIEDDFETMEIIKTDSNGDIVLEAADKIDENLMKIWCMQSVELS